MFPLIQNSGLTLLFFFLSTGDAITGFGFCGSDEKSSVIEVFSPLYVIYCFPLAASNTVFFQFQWFKTHLAQIFSEFILVEAELLDSINLCLFTKFEKFLPLFHPVDFSCIKLPPA